MEDEYGRSIWEIWEIGHQRDIDTNIDMEHGISIWDIDMECGISLWILTISVWSSGISIWDMG